MSHKHPRHRHNGNIGSALAKIALSMATSVLQKKIEDRNSKRNPSLKNHRSNR